MPTAASTSSPPRSGDDARGPNPGGRRHAGWHAVTAPPRDDPLTFSEEILILLLNDEWETLASLPRPVIDRALLGAVLMDLAFANRIDTGLETLFVIGRTPTGSPLLDPVLAKIAARERPAGTLAWPVPGCSGAKTRCASPRRERGQENAQLLPRTMVEKGEPDPGEAGQAESWSAGCGRR